MRLQNASCKCVDGFYILNTQLRFLSTKDLSWQLPDRQSHPASSGTERKIESAVMRRIYFDNNATTPVLPEIFEAMRPYFGEHFGNASSIHHHGQETRAAVERARESVAQLVGCRPSEIVFTSGGTEGDNLAISGLARPGDHIITSTIEHHAVLNTCKHLEGTGIEITYVPVDGRGMVDPDDVRRALRPTTRLVTIMMANNETGVLQPVEEIGKVATEADVYFHTDAVQAAGKVALDRSEERRVGKECRCQWWPGGEK